MKSPVRVVRVLCALKDKGGEEKSCKDVLGLSTQVFLKEGK